MSEEVQEFQELRTAVELLTQIQPWQEYRKLVTFPNKKQPVSLKSLEKLLTEELYLICYLNANPCRCFITKKIMITNTKSQEEQAKRVLVLEAEREEADSMLESVWQKDFQRLQVGQGKWAAAMRTCADRFVQSYNQCKMKGLILVSRANEFLMKCQLDEFCFVYLQQIRPKIHLFRDPTALLRALQETRLFRQSALLYKFCINSITARIADNKKSQHELRTAILEFQKERLEFLKSPRAKMESIDLMVEKVFKQLSVSKILSLCCSLNDKEEEKSDGQTIRIGKISEGKANEPRALVINISIQEKPYQFLTPPRLEHFLTKPDEDEKPQERKPQQANKMMAMNWRINDFQVSYCAVANQLQVKMLTNHAVRQQQVDLIVSIVHSISLDSISFSIEQHSRKAKSNERCLSLITKAHLHPKESPFLAIFECIDRLTIFSLVIQPDLRLKADISVRRKEKIKELAHHIIQKMRNLLEQLMGS